MGGSGNEKLELLYHNTIMVNATFFREKNTEKSCIPRDI
jgi:hypothetical protein